MKDSKRYALNSQDIRQWIKNLLIFSSPILILILTELQKGTPLEQVKPLIMAALINALIDILRKFVDGK